MDENILIWVGGKHSLGPWIIGKMAPHKRYIEVFMGGGNIFLQKPLATVNVVNDLNSDLINMYKVIFDEKKRKMLNDLFRECVYSRSMFAFFKAIKDDKSWDNYSDVVRAFMFIYINRTSFNGMGMAYARRDDSANLYTLEPIIKMMFNKFQYGKTVFENLPFQDLLTRKKAGADKRINVYDTKDTLIYLDPPYWITTKTKGKTYYEKVMSEGEHAELRDILLGHVFAKWLLSYDHVQEIHDLYRLTTDDGWKAIKSGWNNVYAMLTPSKFQSSSSATGTLVFKQELLIANYPISDVNTLFE